MTIKTLEAYVSALKTDTLVTMCDEIYEWRKTGKLNNDSSLAHLATELCVNTRDIEDVIIRTLTVRLKKTTYVLLTSCPTEFLRGE